MSAQGSALPQNSIFICYRRLDSEEMVDRVYEALTAEFGADSIFRDIDTIPPGVDFPTYIENALRGCPVVLVFIGREWVSCLDERGQPRLQDPCDHVRIEVETALALADTRVIPVLVRRAIFPAEEELPESLRPLRRRNGITIRGSGADYRQDVMHLATALRRSVTEVLENRRRTAEEKQRGFEAEQRSVADGRARKAEESGRHEEGSRAREPERKSKTWDRKTEEPEDFTSPADSFSRVEEQTAAGASESPVHSQLRKPVGPPPTIPAAKFTAGAAEQPPAAEVHSDDTPQSSSSSISIGWSCRVVAGIACLAPPIGGLVVLGFGRRESFVRFYAKQSLILGLGYIAALIACAGIGFAFAKDDRSDVFNTPAEIPLALVIFSVTAVSFLAAVQAFRGKEWELPWIGKIARRPWKSESDGL